MKNLLTNTVLFFALFCPAFAAGGDAIKLSPEAIGNLKLKFQAVENRALNRSTEASGSTLLNENKVVDVVPKIAGLVSEVKQELGADVKKGDTLFVLESGGLAEAVTSYVEAENAMTFALAALQQEKSLADKNLSSKEQLREKELEFKKAVSGHARALQPLKLLGFNEGSIHVYLSHAEGKNYTRLEVKSPAHGEVIKREIRLGASVDPDVSLFTIADLSDLWVDFFVSLREIGKLTVGTKVTVSSSVSDQAREATISYIAPVADERNRTVRVRATMKNTDHQWRPGTPVLVTVHVSSGRKVLTVPSDALVILGGETVVFVREKDGAFKAVAVKTGDSDDTNTAILSGVKSGQTVVSENAAQLKGHLEMTAEDAAE